MCCTYIFYWNFPVLKYQYYPHFIYLLGAGGGTIPGGTQVLCLALCSAMTSDDTQSNHLWCQQMNLDWLYCKAKTLNPVLWPLYPQSF